MIIKSYSDYEQETAGAYMTGAHTAAEKALSDQRITEDQAYVRPSRFTEYTSAAFQKTNEITALAFSESLPFIFDKVDPNYKPYNEYGEWEGTKYEEMLSQAKNADHMTALKKFAERDKRNDEILENTPFVPWLLTTLAAGALSPTVLLPAYKTVQAARGGVSIGKTALSGVAFGGGAMMVYEGAMSAAMPNRTREEAAITIGAGAALGGFLGGAAATLTKASYKEMGKDLMEELAKLQKGLDDEGYVDVNPQSIGAAAAPEQIPTFSAEELKLQGAGARALSYADSRLGPLASGFNKMMNTQSVAARNAFIRLMEVTVPLLGNDAKALPTSVETMMNVYQGRYARFYKSYKESLATRRKLEKSNNLEVITNDAFNERVARALRNNDIDPQYPEVTQAAQAARKYVLEPLRRDAIDVGLFDENVSAAFADSYLMRVWDRGKLLSHKDQALDMFETWAGKKVNEYVRSMEASIKELTRQAAKKASKSTDKKIQALQDELRSIENAKGNGYDEYIKEVAEKVYDQLAGHDISTASPFIKSAVTRGPLKEKLIDIEDNAAEFFLNNNALDVLQRYTHKAGVDVAMTKNFGRADMADQIKEIMEEYKGLIDGAKSAAAKAKLVKERDGLVGNLEMWRDIMRGDYKRFDNPDGLGAQAHTLMRDINYMSTLGAVTESSLPDIGRHIAFSGIKNSFGDIYTTFFRNFDKIKKQMDVDELNALGFGFETTMATRIVDFSGVDDPFSRGSKLTKLSGITTAKFSQLVGINHWNDFGKNAIARATQRRIFQSLEKGDAKYLRFLGFDEADMAALQKNFKEHGTIIDNTYYSGIDNWADYRLADKYRAAIRKEANTFIVSKSIADVPMWANTPIGQLLFQLKSFTYASYQRMLLRGLSENNAAFWSSVLFSVAIGHVVNESKQSRREISAKITGRKLYEPKDESPFNAALLDAIDRSGMVAKLLEMNNLSRALQGPAIEKMAGVEIFSRHQDLQAYEFLAGPSSRFISAPAAFNSVIGAIGDSEEDVKKSDIRKIRQILPFQNVIFLSYFFDALEGGANKALNAK